MQTFIEDIDNNITRSKENIEKLESIKRDLQEIEDKFYSKGIYDNISFNTQTQKYILIDIVIHHSGSLFPEHWFNFHSNKSCFKLEDAGYEAFKLENKKEELLEYIDNLVPYNETSRALYGDMN